MNAYKASKILILKHFGIYLSDTDMEHLNELQSEIAVDQWGRSVILNHLECFDQAET